MLLSPPVKSCTHAALRPPAVGNSLYVSACKLQLF